MTVVKLANLSWIAYSPSRFQLPLGHCIVDLYFDGINWCVSDGQGTAIVYSRDHGAAEVARVLDRDALNVP